MSKIREDHRIFINRLKFLKSMKNILVSIDFHDKTRLLIEQAVNLARAFKSKIWLIHMAAPDPDFVGYGPGPEYIREDRAIDLKNEHELLRRYRIEMRENGLDTEALLIQGATVETILDEIERLNIDLIILGHHEHSIIYNLFHESVSDKVIQKSNIPMLIIPF